MTLRIDRLDHLVLTVASIGETCDFYARVLGMDVSHTAVNIAELMKERGLRPENLSTNMDPTRRRLVESLLGGARRDSDGDAAG